MKSRVIPFSLVIASAIIFCTAFRCNKEEIENTAWMSNYFSFINNSENSVLLCFESFECFRYYDEKKDHWEILNSPYNFEVVLYPMEKVIANDSYGIRKDKLGSGEEREINFASFRKMVSLYHSCISLYEYDVKTQTKGKTLNIWKASPNANIENTIFDYNRWSFYQIDSLSCRWNTNLFE